MPTRSKVEVTGWEARHYDRLMDVLFLGRHQAFIRDIVRRMEIQPGNAVLDLGAGTGRHLVAMLTAAGPTGRGVGVDIGDEMLRQARQRCRGLPNATLLQHRIEEPLPFDETFDVALISFVMHGLEDATKDGVLTNAHRALKADGTLWILDYNEFDLKSLWQPLRWAFTHLECELACEFLRQDLKAMLARHGFGGFVTHLFYRDRLRLLGARKAAGRRP
jgi:ubiquinone/menaquinone biosynthesis C-methylase UbiE